VAGAYRASFLEGRGVGLATARAGNVIGGGDWGAGRIVPDFMRAARDGIRLALRRPDAIRPWQHVLEPLAGYLHLAARLWQDPARGAEAYNFGPGGGEHARVEQLVAGLAQRWPTPPPVTAASAGYREAGRLQLDCTKAGALLGWRPVLDLEQALTWTVQWYRLALADPGADLAPTSLAQIRAYTERAAAAGVAWAGTGP
jgi:CDP-glucose 4,6-dehydratase